MGDGATAQRLFGESEAQVSKRKVHLTGQIKPSTRNALMDQLALAADEIIRLRQVCVAANRVAEASQALVDYLDNEPPCRFWHHLKWWR